MSGRFDWDNKDKPGWSTVRFELLGTSEGSKFQEGAKSVEMWNREIFERE